MERMRLLQIALDATRQQKDKHVLFQRFKQSLWTRCTTNFFQVTNARRWKLTGILRRAGTAELLTQQQAQRFHQGVTLHLRLVDRFLVFWSLRFERSRANCGSDEEHRSFTFFGELTRKRLLTIVSVFGTLCTKAALAQRTVVLSGLINGGCDLTGSTDLKTAPPMHSPAVSGNAHALKCSAMQTLAWLQSNLHTGKPA